MESAHFTAGFGDCVIRGDDADARGTEREKSFETPVFVHSRRIADREGNLLPRRWSFEDDGVATAASPTDHHSPPALALVVQAGYYPPGNEVAPPCFSGNRFLSLRHLDFLSHDWLARFDDARCGNGSPLKFAVISQTKVIEYPGAHAIPPNNSTI